MNACAASTGVFVNTKLYFAAKFSILIMYEEINPAEEESTSAFDVEISERVIYYLQQTCRWAMLLVYFTGGALLLFVLIMAVKWADVEDAFYRAYGTYESVFIAVLVCLVLVYGVLLGLLYNFTFKVKRGILAQDVVAIQQGM